MRLEAILECTAHVQTGCEQLKNTTNLKQCKTTQCKRERHATNLWDKNTIDGENKLLHCGTLQSAETNSYPKPPLVKCEENHTLFDWRCTTHTCARQLRMRAKTECGTHAHSLTHLHTALQTLTGNLFGHLCCFERVLMGRPKSISAGKFPTKQCFQRKRQTLRWEDPRTCPTKCLAIMHHPEA